MNRLFVGVLCFSLVFTFVVSQDTENFDVETVENIDTATQSTSLNPARSTPFTGTHCSICNETPAVTCAVKEQSSGDKILVKVKCYDSQEKVLKESESSRENPFPNVQFSRTHIQSNISYKK